MAGCNKTQLYLTILIVTVILLVASQAVEARFKKLRFKKLRFKNLCTQTPYPKLCWPMVKGPNPRRAIRTTIRHLEAKTRLAIAGSARHRHGNKAIGICHATLTDAAHNLGSARQCIMKRNVLSLKRFLTAAVSDYGVCVDGFIASRQVNSLQNAADELRKMGSNCLLLATLIR